MTYRKEVNDALDARRDLQISVTPGFVDTSEGMAALHEGAEFIGVFTVVFCKEFCKDHPTYAWEKINETH